LLAEVRDADHVRPFDHGHALIGRIDGLLVAVGHWGDAELANWQSLNLPIVFVQRDVPNAPSAVLMDEERSAAAMVEHLVGLGHRDIAHVAGALDTDTGLRRRRGVIDAAKRAGLTIPARWIVDGGFTADGGLRATLAILRSRGRRPSALAVANLTSALGALDALREAELRVPDDVSLIAIDDHFVAAHTNPPLTTVRTAQRVLGRAAADGIIDAIESGKLARTVIPNGPIVVPRESTARLRTEPLPRRSVHQTRARFG
jgi:DNA-binding LacI/PurR family transcriptional regulator